MSYDYDDQNIFAKILRGEIPNDTVLETEHSLAFRDIQPHAPVHVLVIPKGAYVSFDHFAAEADPVEIVDFTRALGRICQTENVCPVDGHEGYRLLSNAGPAANQEVPHMHMHLVGGHSLGAILPRGG
ncbi:HIT domain-containing protein [Actibacterium sp. 188UL27-1]|uniref:HIT domain-containing protein n=1 Tax=Actibacterium sp. 188UL27-1 TaxID=2786961 RepID=UPI00195C6CC0|nr:HIT domain-containing protein [Actibacterium sp. 188UL27-1]MBM7069515.1 HIT domain-containing protein [Actibacterium sp. 188UL27-1]